MIAVSVVVLPPDSNPALPLPGLAESLASHWYEMGAEPVGIGHIALALVGLRAVSIML